MHGYHYPTFFNARWLNKDKKPPFTPSPINHILASCSHPKLQGHAKGHVTPKAQGTRWTND
ncbi:hypothetical protein Lal_00000956 [Lupinus albus]|nr:hypothetical protein Lal_00000956 [Lupinus albus]